MRQTIEQNGFHSLFADDSLRALLKAPSNNSLPLREGRGEAYSLPFREGSGVGCWGEVHFVIGNLECPVTTIHAPAYKRFMFRGDPLWLDSIRAYGFTHLNLANNHSVDQGRRGLADTRRNIINAGLVPVGADSTMQRAAQPVLLSTSPRRVWLLVSNRLPLENYAYLPEKMSVSQQPMDSLLSHVRALKDADSTAVVIVNLHWGTEHTLKPTPRQQLEAHALIDAGADAVIGHHTHTLQIVETYKEKPIYYSIGNFIFDLQKPLNTRACIVRLTITENNVTAETIPIRIDRCAPQIIPRTN